MLSPHKPPRPTMPSGGVQCDAACLRCGRSILSQKGVDTRDVGLKFRFHPAVFRRALRQRSPDATSSLQLVVACQRQAVEIARRETFAIQRHGPPEREIRARRQYAIGMGDQRQSRARAWRRRAWRAGRIAGCWRHPLSCPDGPGHRTESAIARSGRNVRRGCAVLRPASRPTGPRPAWSTAAHRQGWGSPARHSPPAPAGARPR